MKKLLFVFLFVFSFTYAQCPLEKLAEDLVEASDEFKSFVNTEDGYKAWNDFVSIGKKENGIAQGHSLRSNEAFLKKYNALSDEKKVKLRETLDKQKAFPDYKGKVNYMADRNIDIGDGVVKKYSVNYDEYGYPKFEAYCPNGYNVKGEELANGAYFQNGKRDLDGTGNDMTAANKWALEKFGPEKFRSLPGGNCEIKINDNWIKYTWHHHQDGKTIFPVPSGIHNASSVINGTVNKGFPHSGGASLIKEEPILRGFFPEPQF